MFWRALMMVGLTVMPVLGQAQAGADSVAIVEAAARWYASRLPTNSRVGFLLPGGPRSGPAPTAVQLEAAQQGARILRATLMPFDSVSAKLCDRRKLGDCGPGKFDQIVEVRVSTVTGNASEVFVTQRTTTGGGPRLRHAVRGWKVLVVRSGDAWAFSRILNMSMS